MVFSTHHQYLLLHVGIDIEYTSLATVNSSWNLPPAAAILKINTATDKSEMTNHHSEQKIDLHFIKNLSRFLQSKANNTSA